MIKRVHLFSGLALLALLVCFSCEKPAGEPDFYEYRFDLSYGGNVGASGFSLKAGDRVGLYLSGGETLSGEAVEESGRMVVKALSGEAVPDGTAVYPFYPYVGDCSAGGGVEVVISSEQQGDIRSIPLSGEPFRLQTGKQLENNGSIRFKSMAALVDVRIYSSGIQAGEPIESVYLRTTDGARIAGKATARLTSMFVGGSRAPVLSLVGDGAQPYVNLAKASVVASSSGAAEPYYLFVAPGTYSGTLTVVTEAATYSMPFAEIPFSAESAMDLSIDLSAGKITCTPLCNIENARVAGFLDACEKNPYDASDYSYTYVTDYYTGTGSANRLDLPNPVTVKWTNPSGADGAKTVYVYKNPSMTALELSVPVEGVTAASAAIYNLIPGKTWYYRVEDGGQEIASGVFKTTGRRRMIKVGESTYGKNYANNCRDFGGQVTESGKRIKYGKLFRGSNMDDTSPEAQRMIRDYLKIGLDVDLRSQGTGDRGKYQLDPLSFGTMHTTESYGSWSNLSDKSRMKSTLGRIFNAVDNNTNVYIHCKVGADRTGYVCMLLEALLGVPQNRCDIDYEMTSFSGAVGARTRTGVGNYYYVSKTSDGVTTVQGVDFINTFSGETFQDKAVDYVTNTLGISPMTIKAFQNTMLE